MALDLSICDVLFLFSPSEQDGKLGYDVVNDIRFECYDISPQPPSALIRLHNSGGDPALLKPFSSSYRDGPPSPRKGKSDRIFKNT
jgi:hypothetical protein